MKIPSRSSVLSRFKIDAIETEIRNKIEVEKLALEEQALEAKLQYERQQLRLKKEALKLDKKYARKEIERLETELEDNGGGQDCSQSSLHSFSSGKVVRSLD